MDGSVHHTLRCCAKTPALLEFSLLQISKLLQLLLFASALSADGVNPKLEYRNPK